MFNVEFMGDLSSLFNEQKEKSEMEKMLEWYQYDDQDKTVWKTKDGSFVAVSAMNDEHLENCVKMLNKQIDKAVDSVQNKIATLNISVDDELHFIAIASDWIDVFNKEIGNRKQKEASVCNINLEFVNSLKNRVEELEKENAALRAYAHKFAIATDTIAKAIEQVVE